MGLHQDRDEADLAAPVVSISLGDDCLFRVGGTSQDDPTKSFRLRSGDLVILGGEGRLAYHGVDRIYPSTSLDIGLAEQRRPDQSDAAARDETANFRTPGNASSIQR